MSEIKSALSKMEQKIAPFASQNNAVAEAIVAISEVVKASVSTVEIETSESAEEVKPARKSSKKAAA